VTLSPRDRLALAAGGAAVLVLAVAGWLLLAPSLAQEPGGPDPLAAASMAHEPASTQATDEAEQLVVDVEGGVARAGIVILPGGSRVADAIAAAGGYGPDADLAAAAGSLNLAERLADGQQVYVPRLGEAAAGSTGTAGGGVASGGLVNLNTASPEALEALPGIGPVTVQKIVAARAERPFTTLEELVERDVMHNGQLEDIRNLVTL
jgi:competence protein ComEA